MTVGGKAYRNMLTLCIVAVLTIALSRPVTAEPSTSFSVALEEIVRDYYDNKHWSSCAGSTGPGPYRIALQGLNSDAQSVTDGEMQALASQIADAIEPIRALSFVDGGATYVAVTDTEGNDEFHNARSTRSLPTYKIDAIARRISGQVARVDLILEALKDQAYDCSQRETLWVDLGSWETWRKAPFPERGELWLPDAAMRHFLREIRHNIAAVGAVEVRASAVSLPGCQKTIDLLPILKSAYFASSDNLPPEFPPIVDSGGVAVLLAEGTGVGDGYVNISLSLRVSGGEVGFRSYRTVLLGDIAIECDARTIEKYVDQLDVGSSDFKPINLPDEIVLPKRQPDYPVYIYREPKPNFRPIEITK